MIRWALFAHLAVPLVLGQVSDPAADLEKARQLVASGHSADALPIYNRLVHAYPENPDLLLNLAVAEYSAEQYNQAAAHSLAALKLSPALAPANLFLGASYLKLGDPASALDPLHKAVESLPGDRNARLMLAEACLGSLHFDEALTRFRTAAELLPDNPRAWFGLGKTYDALSEKARRELQSSYPNSSYWFAVAGATYLKQRRFGSAFAAYREALGHGPIVTGIHAGLAQIYRETGHPQWAAAESALENLVPPQDDSSTAPAILYRTYHSNRDLALDAYKKLDRLPPSLESHLHHANQLQAEGRHREAALEWREVLKLNSADNAYRLGLAQSLYDGRDCEEALSALSKVLQADPKSASANFLNGACLVTLEQPAAAVPYLQAARELDPQLRPAAGAALGHALLRLGKAQQAIPYLKSAAATDADGSVRFQLFRAYQLTGDSQSASHAFADYQASKSSLDEQRTFEEGSRLTGPPEQPAPGSLPHP